MLVFGGKILIITFVFDYNSCSVDNAGVQLAGRSVFKMGHLNDERHFEIKVINVYDGR